MRRVNKGRLFISIAGLCVLFGILIGCGSSANNKKLEQALELWKEGNHGRARKLLETYISKETNSELKSRALNQLGLLLWEIKEMEGALDAFRQSRSIETQITKAELNYGIALFHMNQFAAAESSLKLYLKSFPQDAVAESMLALIQVKQDNWAGAETKVQELCSSMPSDPACQNMQAIVDLNNKKVTKAIARLKQLRDYPPAIYNLAIIHDQWLGEDRAALEYYQQYIEHAAANEELLEKAKQKVNELGDKSSRTRRNDDIAEDYSQQGYDLLKQEKYREAISKYELAVRHNPKHTTSYYYMGLANLKLGDYFTASKMCRKALELNSQYTEAQYLLSLSLFRDGKLSEAQRAAERVLQLKPDHDVAPVLLREIKNAK